jgi:multidrug efflux pump
MKHRFKFFKPTNWAIDNKTSMYVLTVILILLGISSYISLPKEQFPDIVVPTIMVSTVYPGSSPANMESLVTRPIEKQIKGLTGIKKITSSSVQDFSSIAVEFNAGENIADSKQKVKDAVDKARQDLPSDLPNEPTVQEINFSDFPIMNINLSGDISLPKLKDYAKNMKDRLEEIPEVTRVDMIGAPDREIQVDVDEYKMAAAQMSINDVNNAVASENVIIAGGQVPMNGMKWSLKVDGQFTSADQIANLVVGTVAGSKVYLKDIATVTDGFKEKDSYARLDKKNVITLNVIKRSGENLINASDKIHAVVNDYEQNVFPSNLNVSITNDQSVQTRNTLNDLINTIIIGFILVTVVLMFFMGTTNAIFVGMSVPLSSFIGFLCMPLINMLAPDFHYTFNLVVLFAVLFALGIVVDDAIVVIENTHRIFHKTKMTIGQAAKFAAGEVFVPVFAGTLTMLAPFIPLAFWPGLIGKFMVYLPITLIITLLASLVVAFVFNPVFAVSFMKAEEKEPKPASRRSWIWMAVFAVVAILFDVAGVMGLGNLILLMIVLVLFNRYVLTGVIKRFQQKVIPAMKNLYGKVVHWALRSWHPYFLFGMTVILFIVSPVLFVMREGNKIVFFPSGAPNDVMVFIKTPIGTDVAKTDSITKTIEKKVYAIIGDHNPIVDAVITNVAIGADENGFASADNVEANKAKITVAFKEFRYRHGVSTQKYMDEIRQALKNMPGVQISVGQEQNGPPTGKAINIEISGDDLHDLIASSQGIKHYLDSLQIPGVEGLNSDMEVHNPEAVIVIDREEAQRQGISTGQIGQEIRNAVYGKEASKFRDKEDEYSIMVRYDPAQRKSIDDLMNLKMTYRTNSGQLMQIPLSAVAHIDYQQSVGGIQRINLKRVVTISSNVLSGYSAPAVNQQILNDLKNYKLLPGIEFSQTGESQDIEETQSFLGNALLIALMLIFLILVTQFNSVSKPLIIISEIFFSIIGVMLGFAIFGNQFSIAMSGMGIVGLAGIVVKNGILLVEFTDELKTRGMKTRDAIIEGGKTRMIPVLLTASATVLGLIPLATGFNINFVTLFTELNPHLYFGGDNSIFWGPLSWTIIYGLIFATFLTLVLVPSMYYIMYVINLKLLRRKIRKGWRPEVETPLDQINTEDLV